MNDIVVKARTNSLQPDDVMDGTYTISNIGTFGNIIGTPIINQPQVAIMAVGSITKKPVVIEVDGREIGRYVCKKSVRLSRKIRYPPGNLVQLISILNVVVDLV